MSSARFGPGEYGFSLMEVLVSVALLTAISSGLAQLVAVAVTSNLNARGQTSTSILAMQKMEQLRGLTWGYEPDTGLPRSDTTTDLSTDPPTGAGRGLSSSPSATMDANTSGYVDYLGGNGAWLGNGAEPEPGTYYIRRWSVTPLPADPRNTLVLQVLVTTLRREARTAGGGPRQRLPDDSWLVSVKTRTVP